MNTNWQYSIVVSYLLHEYNMESKWSMKKRMLRQILLNSINYSLLGSTARYFYPISNIDHQVKIIQFSRSVMSDSLKSQESSQAMSFFMVTILNFAFKTECFTILWL